MSKNVRPLWYAESIETKERGSEMATYLKNAEYPTYGQWWTAPDGLDYWLLERSFPRSNRMVCLMENEQGYAEYFVFPY